MAKRWGGRSGSVNYLDLIKFIKGSQYYFSGHLRENTLYFTQESHPPVTPRVLWEKKCESVTCSVMFDSLWPHGLQPTKLLCPWDSPGKNTGVGCHSLLQGIFRTQGSNPGVLHCRQILYQLSHQGSPPPNSQAEASPSALRVFGTEHLLCRSPWWCSTDGSPPSHGSL